MKVLITGGAGFIGSNLANQLIADGHRVTLFDNLSRRGTPSNLAWLREKYADHFEFVQGDVRDYGALVEAANGAEAIFHLAAQVAVTTSVADPRLDFDVNALGTFHVLEAARHAGREAILLYTSTNKVYGGMEDELVAEGPTRYDFARLPQGVPESQSLDFHSPYGCSKGAGDQYTRDYARIYGLRTIVFRQSCIYGPRQFGVEDQGWVAYFCIAAALGLPITIYGNGKQVRDVLYIDDLTRAMRLAVEHVDRTAGQIYNIGGGPTFSISIWNEFHPILEELAGHPIPIRRRDWRPGDQRIYISDIRKAERDFGWRPQVSPREGIGRLWNWVQENQTQIKAALQQES